MSRIVASRTRDGHRYVQISNRPIRVQPEIRHVAAGIVEVRRVERVERFNAELHVHIAWELELSKYAAIPIRISRPAEHAPGRGAKSRLRDRFERERIEVRIASADAAENLDVRDDLISALTASRGR